MLRLLLCGTAQIERQATTETPQQGTTKAATTAASVAASPGERAAVSAMLLLQDRSGCSGLLSISLTHCVSQLLMSHMRHSPRSSSCNSRRESKKKGGHLANVPNPQVSCPVHDLSVPSILHSRHFLPLLSSLRLLH